MGERIRMAPEENTMKAKVSLGVWMDEKSLGFVCGFFFSITIS